MTLRGILRCLRHLRTWRQCLYEEVKREPPVARQRSERLAAIQATRTTLREVWSENEPASEPVTAMIEGTYRPPRRRRSPPRSRQKGTP